MKRVSKRYKEGAEKKKTRNRKTNEYRRRKDIFFELLETGFKKKQRTKEVKN